MLRRGGAVDVYQQSAVASPMRRPASTRVASKARRKGGAPLWSWPCEAGLAVEVFGGVEQRLDVLAAVKPDLFGSAEDEQVCDERSSKGASCAGAVLWGDGVVCHRAECDHGGHQRAERDAEDRLVEDEVCY
jgi:hypothetical protein